MHRLGYKKNIQTYLRENRWTRRGRKMILENKITSHNV